MRELAGNPALRQQMGRSNTRSHEIYSISSTMINRYQELYESVLGSRDVRNWVECTRPAATAVDQPRARAADEPGAAASGPGRRGILRRTRKGTSSWDTGASA